MAYVVPLTFTHTGTLILVNPHTSTEREREKRESSGLSHKAKKVTQELEIKLDSADQFENF